MDHTNSNFNYFLFEEWTKLTTLKVNNNMLIHVKEGFALYLVRKWRTLPIWCIQLQDWQKINNRQSIFQTSNIVPANIWYLSNTVWFHLPHGFIVKYVYYLSSVIWFKLVISKNIKNMCFEVVNMNRIPAMS